MKKFIFLSAIILSSLTSCSPDDMSTYNENTGNKTSKNETNSVNQIIIKDTISNLCGSTFETDPTKPIKP